MEILRRSFKEPDRMQVQESAINSVVANQDSHLTAYVRDPRSFRGRFVSADLFKETFAEYAQSNEGRNRYNAAVHNSAAVLSAIQLNQLFKDDSEPWREEVVFLTGIPGAGKTSSVVANNYFPDHIRAIFEGQLSNPESAMPKFEAALNVGLKLNITVVHAKPENALNNTIKRFEDIGRGANIELMANIQGNLPDGLQKLYSVYGESVEFRIIDARDRTKHVKLKGWQHLDILRSEGNYEIIKSRLNSEIERLNKNGAIGRDAYRQAKGLAPITRQLGRLAGRVAGSNEQDEQGRSLPKGSGEKNILISPAKGSEKER